MEFEKIAISAVSLYTFLEACLDLSQFRVIQDPLVQRTSITYEDRLNKNSPLFVLLSRKNLALCQFFYMLTKFPPLLCPQGIAQRIILLLVAKKEKSPFSMQNHISVFSKPTVRVRQFRYHQSEANFYEKTSRICDPPQTHIRFRSQIIKSEHRFRSTKLLMSQMKYAQSRQICDKSKNKPTSISH